MTVIPAVLLAIVFHELCHGFAAYLLGDMTAKERGRLSLNPIAHIDPVGALCMVFFGVGWAKPVPVSPYHFRMKNKKIGMALVSLAGPLANIVLAFVCMFVAILLMIYGGQSAVLGALSGFLSTTAVLSVGLAAFNLLPIPPLDGSKILMPFLPNRAISWIYQYEGYIRFVLLAALFLGALNGVIGELRYFLLSMLENGVLSVLFFFGVL